MNYKIGFFLLSIFFIILFSWAVLQTIEEDPINSPFTKNNTSSEIANLDLQILKNLPIDQIGKNFPKQKLIDSIEYENPQVLNQVIDSTLSLMKGDSMQVYRYFVKSIFEETVLKKESNYVYRPEKLLHQILVAENFQRYGNFNKLAETYSLAIADLYFQHVSTQLEIIQQKETNLVNKFSYQYLVQRCRDNNYYPNRKESSVDKFMKTFIEHDYFHLINTTFQKTNIFQKLLILFSFIMVTLGCAQSFKFIKKLIFKNA